MTPTLLPASTNVGRRNRLATIAHLAGGQPRVWALLAAGLTIDRLDDLVSALVERFDDLTPYYQQQLDRLSLNERKAVRRLAAADGALSVSELAERTGIEQKSLAKTISDLRRRGWIVRRTGPLADLADQRRSYYQLAEPLARLAFQLKESRGRPIGIVVEFLKAWFDHAALAADDEDSSELALRYREAAHQSLLTDAPLAVARALADHGYLHAFAWATDPTVHLFHPDPKAAINEVAAEVLLDLDDAVAAYQAGDPEPLLRQPPAISQLIERQLAEMSPGRQRLAMARLGLNAESGAGWVPRLEGLCSLTTGSENVEAKVLLALHHLRLSQEGPADLLLDEVSASASRDEFSCSSGPGAGCSKPGTRLGPERSSRQPVRRLLPKACSPSPSRSRPRTSGQDSYGTSSASGNQRRASWKARSVPIAPRRSTAATTWLAPTSRRATCAGPSRCSRPPWPTCERVLGPDHPDTLTSRNNLACAYESAGDLGRAVPLFEATLADRERVLGPDHPHTLTSRNNLACAYESAGDLGRAVPLFEATLADCERVLGPDHPQTLTSSEQPGVRLRIVGRPRPSSPALRVHPGRLRTGTRTRPPRNAHQPQQPGRRLPIGGRPGPSRPAVRGHPGRLRAGPRSRPPRHAHQPQQPCRRLPVGGRLGPGSPALRVHPGRPRAGPRSRPPPHAQEPQQAGPRLPVGGRPGSGHPAVRGHPGRPRAGARSRASRHDRQPQHARGGEGGVRRISDRFRPAVDLARRAQGFRLVHRWEGVALDESFESILSAARGDAGWAYERLYRDLSPAVCGYLRLQGAREPEDLTSEVFIGAFRGLGSFVGSEAQFRSWIFTIAHRRLIDERRRFANRPQPVEFPGRTGVDGYGVDGYGGDVGGGRPPPDERPPGARPLRIPLPRPARRAPAAHGVRPDRRGRGRRRRQDHRRGEGPAAAGALLPPPGFRPGGRTPLSVPGDHQDEMLDDPHPADPDDDFADLLTEGWLVPFGQDVRFACRGPVPVPTPELAALLEHGVLRSGFSIDKGDLLVTAASNVHGPAPQAAGLPKWRKERRMSPAFLTALIGKIVGAGTVAKATVATVTAAATMTVAGAAAGVLPGPVQGVVGGAINAVSPLNVPTDEVDKIVQSATDTVDGVLGRSAGPSRPAPTCRRPSARPRSTARSTCTCRRSPASRSPASRFPTSRSRTSRSRTCRACPTCPSPPSPTSPTSGPSSGRCRCSCRRASRTCSRHRAPLPNPTALLAQIPACIQTVLGTAGLPVNVSQCVASVLGTVSGVLNPAALGSLPQLNVSACVPLDMTACTSSILASTGAANAPFVGDILRSVFGTFGGGVGTGGSSFWGNLGFNFNLPGLNAIPAGCAPIDVSKCLTSVTGSLGSLPASGGVPKVNLSSCMPTGLTSGLPGIGGGIPGLSGIPFFPF